MVEGSSSLRVDFQDIKPLLMKIKKFEVSVQTSVYVAGIFPCGVDRIMAYRFAVHCTEKWLRQMKEVN